MTCSYKAIDFFKNIFLFSRANLLYLFNNLSNLIILTKWRAKVLREIVGIAEHASRRLHYHVLWLIADRLLIRLMAQSSYGYTVLAVNARVYGEDNVYE